MCGGRGSTGPMPHPFSLQKRSLVADNAVSLLHLRPPLQPLPVLSQNRPHSVCFKNFSRRESTTLPAASVCKRVILLIKRPSQAGKPWEGGQEKQSDSTNKTGKESWQLLSFAQRMKKTHQPESQEGKVTTVPGLVLKPTATIHR